MAVVPPLAVMLAAVIAPTVLVGAVKVTAPPTLTKLLNVNGPVLAAMDVSPVLSAASVPLWMLMPPGALIEEPVLIEKTAAPGTRSAAVAPPSLKVALNAPPEPREMEALPWNNIEFPARNVSELAIGIAGAMATAV